MLLPVAHPHCQYDLMSAIHQRHSRDRFMVALEPVTLLGPLRAARTAHHLCQRGIIVYDRPLTIEQMLTMLAGTPPRLAGITEDLTPAQLLAPPEPGEWSARDVLAHLRACSDMWGKYIAVILSEDQPTFKAVNPTTWIKQTNYREPEFQASLQAFSAQRAELLAVLKPLAPEAWSRTATVMTAGRPRERTVYTYAQWLANHEQPHIKQTERIANTVHMQQTTACAALSCPAYQRVTLTVSHK